MFTKIATVSLALLVAMGSLNASAFAAGNEIREKTPERQTVSVREGKITREAINGFSRTAVEEPSQKITMAEYNRTKAQGKGFSTGKKIAIGVGIALGVVAIVAFAASRDEIRTF